MTSIEESEETEVAEGLLASQIVAGEDMNIQHASFEPGAVLEEHSHQHEQITFVYEGEFDIVIDGDRHTMETGDVCVIDGHTPHMIINESNGIARVVDVFHPARQIPPWEEDE